MVARLREGPVDRPLLPALERRREPLGEDSRPARTSSRSRARVARTSPALYPDAVTVVGFCLLVKREVIRTLGVFDEAFGRGYGEETDLHYRARAAGWRCVVADDTFVYHRHGASFADGDERTREEPEIVMGRWGAVHERELAEFDRENALGAVRDADDVRVDPVRTTGPRRPHDVLFVLPMLASSGGVAAVLELANALILDGVQAGVVVLGEAHPEIAMRALLRAAPDDAGGAARALPGRRSSSSRPPTRRPRSSPSRPPGAPASQTAYFVQDYEGWFGADGARVRRRRTYDADPADDGRLDVARRRDREAARPSGPVPVPISADPDVFYPRGDRPTPRRSGSSRCSAPRSAAACRSSSPRSPRSRTGPTSRSSSSGTQPVPQDAPRFRTAHLGVLPRDDVATLLSTAHVVVDPSLFQGFGLVGLEGMSCGAACVLTDSGGVPSTRSTARTRSSSRPGTRGARGRHPPARRRPGAPRAARARRPRDGPPVHVGADGDALPRVHGLAPAGPRPCRAARARGARPPRLEHRTRTALAASATRWGRR